MNRWLKWIWIPALGLLVVVVAVITLPFLGLVAPTNDVDNQDPAKQAEMVRLTLAWGRLAPFPENVQDFSIRTEGSAFTRSFRASFAAPDEEIEEWIAASPGLVDAEVKTTDDGKREYVIHPGEGACCAEVTIDFAAGKVQVYVAWS